MNLKLKWMIKKYMVQYHPDKVRNYNMSEEEKELWMFHGRRLGNFKEWFDHELYRYIYDRVRVTEKVTVYAPVFMTKVPVVPRLEEMTLRGAALVPSHGAHVSQGGPAVKWAGPP